MDEQRDIIPVLNQTRDIVDYFSDHPFLLFGLGVGSCLMLTSISIGILLDNKFINKGER